MTSYLTWREICSNTASIDTSMSVLAVIPARLAATRLPRKPLRLLGGLPLVIRVYQRVLALDAADHCVVATDSTEVMDVCAAHGVPAVMTASTHPSGTDRVAEVAQREEYRDVRVILNVQGDEPFVSAEALSGAVGIVQRGQAAVGTVAVRIDPDMLHRADVVKVVRRDDGKALYFSRAPIPFLREAADAALLAPMVFQHVGVYAYSRDALLAWVSWPPHPLEQIERLEQLRPLAHGVDIGVTEIGAAEPGIDTEDDLERANRWWDTHHAALGNAV
jgi:3-deoxy-manno-octulosonate cytidylyltransferase (CMP-KDO synthetase)